MPAGWSAASTHFITVNSRGNFLHRRREDYGRIVDFHCCAQTYYNTGRRYIIKKPPVTGAFQLGVILFQPSHGKRIDFQKVRWRTRMTMNLNCLGKYTFLTTKVPARTLIFKLFNLQRDLFFQHHLPEVDKPVAHSSQGCIDAAIGECRNFFETQFSVMSEDDYFALIFR